MGSLVPPPVRLLVVDDEPGIREMLEILFRRHGYAVECAAGFRSAMEALAAREYSVVVTDLVMPDGSGLNLLAEVKRRHASAEVILLTAHGSVENAIEAMRKGAYDFLSKPFDPAELNALVSKALEKQQLVVENDRLKAQVEQPVGPGDIVGKSPAMRNVMALVERIASTRTTVLITGESGTGKERVARELHDRSDRSGGPFLVVNCGALPEALMESELFGHERGAFTGASSRSTGIFREADGGTLLLDEVGELPLPLQVKLLRVLQERAVRPVGAAAEVPVDVRVLAATNRSVEDDVAAGSFRQDLYYRLNVLRLELPPLRERQEDVPLLAERFMKRFAMDMGKDVVGFSSDALRALTNYGFPGNVRELENIVERAVALSGSRTVGLGDLPPDVSGRVGGSGADLLILPEEGCDLDVVLAEVERRLITQALERTGGVRKAAAGLLGVTFRSLRYRLDKLDLDPDSGPSSSELGNDPAGDDPG